MANKQVVRAKKHHQLPAALLAHLDGRTRPAEARERPELKLKPAVVLVDDVENARKALAVAKAIKARGRPGTIECVEFLFAGPPPFESPDAWPKDRLHGWLQANVAWVRKCAGPNAVIPAAYYHTDERSPHLHLLLIPINATGRLSWKSVERGFALDPKVPAKLIMSSMQDHYQAEVGKRFGLERGEVGSRRKHEPINRRKGFIERVLEAPSKWSDRQRAETALLKAEDAERERDRAVQRQREAETQRDGAEQARDAAVEAQDLAHAEAARATEERDQAVATAATADAERDDASRSRSQVLRDRDEARKALEKARHALELERKDRTAEMASWKDLLRKTAIALKSSIRTRDEALQENERLRAAAPPTQVQVDEARAQAREANEARGRAEAERAKANEGWNGAYQGYLTEKQRREDVAAERDRDVAAARQQGYKQGQASRDTEVEAARANRDNEVEAARANRDNEVEAAVKRAGESQAELDALRGRLPTEVQLAHQKGVAAGRAERDDDVATLQQTAERLKTDLDTARQEGDQVADQLKDVKTKLTNVTAHRDDLWKKETSQTPKQATVARQPAAQHGSQAYPSSSRTQNR